MRSYLRKIASIGAMAAVVAVAAVVHAGLPPDVPDAAHGTGSVDEGNPRVETRLIVDKNRVEPGGSLRAGVHFAIDPDWHVYWRNSGDSGMSTEIRWSAEGATFGDLLWPAPEAHEEGDGEIVTFGYTDEVVLQAPVTMGEESGERLEITAKVDYLACKVDCIPGAATLTREVEIGEGEKPASQKEQELLDAAAASVPVSPKEIGIGSEVVYSQKPIRPGDEFRAAIGLNFCAEGPDSCRSYEVAGAVESHRFLPDATSQVGWTTVGVEPHPKAKEGVVLVLEGVATPNAPNDDETLSGIVHLKGPDGAVRAIRIEAPLPRGEEGAETEQLSPTLLEMSSLEGSGTPPPSGEKPKSGAAESPAGTGGGLGFFRALLFAFLGGMILNLMPCVFPVLALKISSFAELVHEDRSHALLHGAAYAGGIVGSMLVLAVVVLGLRVAGTEVGWGFQFQNPVFPAILAAGVVAFAMNLFGVFEIHVSATGLAESTRQASGLRRSLAEGVLAVVLATPCSAPFLGTAVGFALTGSAATVLVVFTSLGLGLAAPFVVLMLVPGWSRVLPDPGPWMVQIRQILGFALLGAAIWLVWVVGRSAGVDGMAQLLTFLGATGFTVWLFGASQEVDWGISTALAGAGVAGALWLCWSALGGASVGVFARYLYGGLVSLAALVVVGFWIGRGEARLGGVAIGAALVGTTAVGLWALDFETNRPTGASQATASAASEEEGSIDWKKWSEERVDGELGEGRPVFVDFTADWCITCKVNENTVLATEQVREAFREYDVAALKADWTDGDERIRRKLESFGKAGVPMYLVYAPERPDSPELLPEVLTPGKVVRAVEEAASNESRARN